MRQLTLEELKKVRYVSGKFLLEENGNEVELTFEDIDGALIEQFDKWLMQSYEVEKDFNFGDEVLNKLFEGVKGKKLTPEVIKTLFMFKDHDRPWWTVLNLRGDGLTRDVEILWKDLVIGYVQEAEFNFPGPDIPEAPYSIVKRVIVGKNYFEFRGLRKWVEEAGMVEAGKVDFTVVIGEDNEEIPVEGRKIPRSSIARNAIIYKNGKVTDEYKGFKYKIGASPDIYRLDMIKADGSTESYRGVEWTSK